MNVDIRPANNEDAAELRLLYRAVRQETFTWIEKTTFRKADYDNDTRGEFVLVATINGSIVGFISVWKPESFIHNLYVLPKYQNNGVGKKLHDAGVKILTMPIKLKCLKRNEQALAFYRQLGWVAIDGGSDEMGEYVLFTLND